MLKPATNEAVQLLLRGAIAFAQMEATGIRIDESYLDKAILEVKDSIVQMEEELRQAREFKLWQKHYGNQTNLRSRPQLGHILFNLCGHKRNPHMRDKDSWKDKNNESAFEHLSLPFARLYFGLEKLKKALKTNLLGIKREVVNGYIHPFFDLHTAESYRSSSSSPNFHNMPVRIRNIAQIVRACVIPRSGCCLIEADYGSQEVRVACCYNKDPKLRDYITGGGDMHKDRALELYILTEGELGDISKDSGKMVRYAAKNLFVFAEFYGSYFAQCAPMLWEGIARLGLKRSDGVSLYKHLRRKGIKSLGACDPTQDVEEGTYEAVVRNVERKMWGEVFTVYDQWKRDWWELYQAQGGVNTLTGFRMEGVFDRNQILCDPIQGCLQGHVRVETSAGHIRIDDLVEVENVRVWTGFRWTKAIAKKMGSHQLARVTLSSGIVLDCDTRHKFKNELNQWVEFKDLKVGDNVALPRIPAPMPHSLDLDNPPFAYGFILGDGHLGRRRISENFTRRYVQIVGGELKKPILEDLFHLLSERWNARWSEIQPTGNRKRKYSLVVEDKRFATHLEEIGFEFGWTAHTKRIPWQIWFLSPRYRRDFMEGLWQSDGSRVKGQERNLHMCNRSLLQEVQMMITPFGFDSNLCKTKDGWLLRVHENNNRQRPHRKYPRAAVDAITGGKIRRGDYDNQSEYRTDTSCYYRKGTEISQRVGERIIQTRDPEAEIYRFDQVVKIESLSKKAVTYTMSVDDPLHQFSAGGVICKNSAFHCLLWSLVQIQKEFRKRKMKSRIILQIHDSLLIDTPKSEVSDVIEIIKRVAIKEVAEHWKWITVPLEVEFERAESNWFSKEKIKT